MGSLEKRQLQRHIPSDRRPRLLILVTACRVNVNADPGAKRMAQRLDCALRRVQHGGDFTESVKRPNLADTSTTVAAKAPGAALPSPSNPAASSISPTCHRMREDIARNARPSRRLLLAVNQRLNLSVDGVLMSSSTQPTLDQMPHELRTDPAIICSKAACLISYSSRPTWTL